MSGLQEWEVRQIHEWLNTAPPTATYILPRIDSVSGEVHGDLTRRQLERGREEENGGQYSEVVRQMYGLE